MLEVKDGQAWQSPFIIALDFDNLSDAMALVDTLNPMDCALKVGSELFTLFGPTLVRSLVARQFRVFLDLKFHDIPHTVARACQAAADLGVWMLNVHAGGGLKMMQAAVGALQSWGSERPLLIGVTVLTSMNAQTLVTLGVERSLHAQVDALAVSAKQAGLDGVVSSAFEVPFIKQHCGSSFLSVTPGIRLAGDSKGDQTRVMTPLEALKAGSDYLVIGRSLTQARNPGKVLDTLLSQAQSL